MNCEHWLWAVFVACFVMYGPACSGLDRQCKVASRVVVRPARVDVYCDDTLAVSLSGPVTKDGF